MGLSLPTFGKLVGVSWQSCQEWERESGTAPSRKRQPKVALVLGVTVDELMHGSSVRAAATEMEKLLNGLTQEQRDKVLAEIRAQVEANKAITKELAGPLKHPPDERVKAALSARRKKTTPRAK